MHTPIRFVHRRDRMLAHRGMPLDAQRRAAGFGGREQLAEGAVAGEARLSADDESRWQQGTVARRHRRAQYVDRSADAADMQRVSKAEQHLYCTTGKPLRAKNSPTGRNATCISTGDMLRAALRGFVDHLLKRARVGQRHRVVRFVRLAAVRVVRDRHSRVVELRAHAEHAAPLVDGRFDVGDDVGQLANLAEESAHGVLVWTPSVWQEFFEALAWRINGVLISGLFVQCRASARCWP
ncbi:hypothetical protein BH09PSE5_BH09PSE5_32690 [soil metagenome]